MPGVQATRGRTYVRDRLCSGCGMRVTIGEPRQLDTWPQRLNLSPVQVRELLSAAAEFRDLCIEAGEYESAVAFVDWMSVDALRKTAA